MKLESDLENTCCDRIKDLGGTTIKVVSPGRRGRPDRLCILPGPRFLFIEFKRERGGVVSALQKRERRILAKLGVAVHFVRTLAEFEELIDE